jgi:hypothetical protein
VLRYYQRLHELLNEQADELRPALERFMARSDVGSPTDRDFRAIAKSVRNQDRQKIWQQVQLNCLHQAVNVADHLRAIAVLLQPRAEGVPVYAHATLARVAMESAAKVAYVHDRAAVFELRFARGVASLITDSDQAVRTARPIPGNAYMPAPGPMKEREHKALLDLVQQARIEVVPGRKGDPKSVLVYGCEAPIVVKASVLVESQFPNMPGIYDILTGVTHGIAARLADNAYSVDRREVWEASPFDVGGSALGAINAAHKVLDAHAWHRGREDDASLEVCRDRIAAVDVAMQSLGSKLSLPQPRLARAFVATS